MVFTQIDIGDTELTDTDGNIIKYCQIERDGERVLKKVEHPDLIGDL
jgi:hypothetical protein